MDPIVQALSDWRSLWPAGALAVLQALGALWLVGAWFLARVRPRRGWRSWVESMARANGDRPPNREDALNELEERLPTKGPLAFLQVTGTMAPFVGLLCTFFAVLRGLGGALSEAKKLDGAATGAIPFADQVGPLIVGVALGAGLALFAMGMGALGGWLQGDLRARGVKWFDQTYVVARGGLGGPWGSPLERADEQAQRVSGQVAALGAKVESFGAQIDRAALVLEKATDRFANAIDDRVAPALADFRTAGSASSEAALALKTSVDEDLVPAQRRLSQTIAAIGGIVATAALPLKKALDQIADVAQRLATAAAGLENLAKARGELEELLKVLQEMRATATKFDELKGLREEVAALIEGLTAAAGVTEALHAIPEEFQAMMTGLTGRLLNRQIGEFREVLREVQRQSLERGASVRHSAFPETNGR